MPTQQQVGGGGGTRFNKIITVGAAVTTLANIVAGILFYTPGYAVSKASDVNIVFDLKRDKWSEIDGVASGTLAVQNPINEDLLCGAPSFNITALGSAFTMDVGLSANATTSGVTLRDNLRIAGAAVYTLSGSAVRDASGYPKEFILNASGSTTDYLTLFSRFGSGHITSGSGSVPCRRLQ